MNDPAVMSMSDRSGELYRGLCERCAQLGMQVWHCDPAGQILVEPGGSKASRDDGIAAAAKAIAAETDPSPREISPGRWLIPIEDRSGVRRVAINFALASTQDAALTPAEIGRLHRVLNWSIEELSRAERDARTIEQFGEKLAQAYEETNLLYRMAKLLNSVNDREQSVTTIGSELQQILPFGWLAIRFSREGYGVKELAGKSIVSGQPPCTSEQLKQLSDAILYSDRSSEHARLLDPRMDPLAAATGAQVLVEPITHDEHLVGLLIAGNKHGPDSELSSFEMQFLDATAKFLGVFHENIARFEEQQELFMGTLRALTAAIDAKDSYTRGHSERVALLGSKMAQVALKLDKATVEQYRVAGLVHDVGKIGVPEAVLCKPARLTDEEFAQIKRHPAIGYQILKDIPALRPVLPGVLSHHERWDGRGYPNGLAGESIPLIGRVLALADTFDAMSSSRAYRPAMPRNVVLDEIRRCAGTQFDPRLAPLFVELDFSDFDRALEYQKQIAQRAA